MYGHHEDGGGAARPHENLQSRGDADLAALRARVEAGNPFCLTPAELVQLLDFVRREMLAAIDAAERRGKADPTLEHFAATWPTFARAKDEP